MMNKMIQNNFNEQVTVYFILCQQCSNMTSGTASTNAQRDFDNGKTLPDLPYLWKGDEKRKE